MPERFQQSKSRIIPIRITEKRTALNYLNMMPEERKTPWSGRHAGKDQLRTLIWTTLKEQGGSLGEPYGHIPNFIGSDLAAARLAELSIWKDAKTIKCNPDTAQLPVRVRALQDGKLLYMAVPRLTDVRCFIEFSSEGLSRNRIDPERALSARQAVKYGRLVMFEEMEPIDLVVTGCVAVTPGGGRTGKGAGFADLELGMLREFDLVTQKTPIITTVHELQIIYDDVLPMQAHDSPLDWIITPDHVIETNTSYPQPTGLDWEIIRTDQFESIPILRVLRDRSGR